VRRLCVALALLSCQNFAADLDTCLATGKCACPNDPAPAPFDPCGDNRDFYVDSAGNDANSGLSPTSAKAKTDTLALLPGDRVHFTGNFTQGMSLDANGSASCPITFSGPATFTTDQDHAFYVSGSFLRFSALDFEGNSTNAGGSSLYLIADTASNTMSDVLLDQLTFHSAVQQTSHVYVQQCIRCTFMRSKFTGEGLVDNAIETWASEQTAVLNSTFTAKIYDSALNFRDHDSLASGNEFAGGKAVTYLNPDTATGNVFERNVVHDMTDGTAVSGANAVRHNTFVNLGTASAADMGVFKSNIVSLAGVGLDAGVVAGDGYNLFNASGAYLGSGPGMTDLAALPKLDQTTYAPLDGSPVIDAADPDDPVPAGGGTRADIGAIERGAVRLASGGYCVPLDGGL
jgi:hypothetical protein